MADQPIEVPVVVGSGTAQVLLCSTITLPTPALEIREIRKTVIVDRYAVVLNKVIVDGRLRQDINYKTLLTGTAPPAPGVVTASGGIVNQSSGNVVHTTVDIAFNLVVPVPGARAGDTCVALQAFVEGGSEEPLGINSNTGTCSQILDQSIVTIGLRASRSQVVAITGAVSVTPPASTAGRPAAGISSVCAGATPGALPGSFIGPAVTFSGPTTEGLPGTMPPTTGPAPATAVTFMKEAISLAPGGIAGIAGGGS